MGLEAILIEDLDKKRGSLKQKPRIQGQVWANHLLILLDRPMLAFYIMEICWFLVSSVWEITYSQRKDAEIECDNLVANGDKIRTADLTMSGSARDLASSEKRKFLLLEPNEDQVSDDQKQSSGSRKIP